MKSQIPPWLLATLAITTAAAQAQDKPKISASLSSTLASDYVSSSGFVSGNGPVNQNYLNIGIGKHLSAALWTNHDLTDDELHERDIYLTAHAQKGNFSGSLSLQNWAYPSGLLGNKDDYGAEAQLNHNGSVNTNLRLTQLLTDRLTANRNRTVLDVSKQFPLGKRTTLKPSVRTAYHNGFYGEHGFGHLTPGVSLQFGKGNISLELFAKRQLSFSRNLPNNTHYGVSLNIKSLKPSRKKAQRQVR